MNKDKAYEVATELLRKSGFVPYNPAIFLAEKLVDAVLSELRSSGLLTTASGLPQASPPCREAATASAEDLALVDEVMLHPETTTRADQWEAWQRIRADNEKMGVVK